jgi:tetratricopeptide (TPR) repeat protein
MEIHVQMAGIELGPYSPKQVRAYLAEGLLLPSDRAREEGTTQWVAVAELLNRLPPATAEPAAAKADAVFAPEEPPPLPSKNAVRLAADRQPVDEPPADEEDDDNPPPAPEAEQEKRAPEPAEGVTHLPTRDPGSFESFGDAIARKTMAIGPTQPVRRSGKITAGSTATTSPLAQASKKVSRTGVTRAGQAKTEPLRSRAPGAPSSALPSAPGAEAGLVATAKLPPASGLTQRTPTPPGAPPPPPGPNMGAKPDTEADAPQPSPGGLQDGKRNLPALLNAMTAKTAPMRAGQTDPTSRTPPPPPPVPQGRPTMPVTSPLPTRAILTPSPRKEGPPDAAPLDIPRADTRKIQRAAVPPNPHPEGAPVEPLTPEEEPKAKRNLAAKLGLFKSKKRDEPAREPAADPVVDPDTAEPLDEFAEPVEEKPRRSHFFLIYLLVAIALVAGYYVWSPSHAAAQLHNALITGAAPDLDATVDFASVQENLKQQVRDQIAAGGDSLSPAKAMLEQSVDLYVTPAGLAQLINKNGQLPQDKVDQAISPDVAANLLTTFINSPVKSQGFSGLTDYVVQTDAGTQHLSFEGLHWRLAQVELPPNLGGSAGITSPAVSTLFKMGQAKADKSDWEGALADFNQVLAMDPKSAAAYNLRAKARQARGDVDGAIKDYTSALDIDPTLAEAYNGRGNARAAKNDLDNAINDFTQAVRLDPTLASAYDARGNAKTAKEDLEGAISDYTQALTLDPTMASAYSDRGFARQANGNLDGAIADYTQALALKPNTAFAYYNRGLARQQQGNVEAAIVDYTRALAFDPRISGAYYNRGNAKNSIHDIDGAIADYTQAVQLNPKLALAYCNRGLARESKADLDGAQADYTKALSLDPKIAVAYYRRGLIRVQRGDLDGAIADSSQALGLDSKNMHACFNRGIAKLAKGNIDGAATDLKTFCESTPHDSFTDYARLYLWLIGRAQNGKAADTDQDLAQALENAWNSPADDVTSKTASFLLGRMTEGDYLSATGSPDLKTDQSQHCEAWYFAGMKRLLMGDKATAIDYFHRCLATGKTDFCEYILAQAELQNLVSSGPSAASTPAPAAAPPTVGSTPPTAAPLPTAAPPAVATPPAPKP